ncbi:hypothetical protein PsorP6_013270 [Peronosclerospora sorghi]|uniref:Uncharacterized protein n=1 Tax=Peronosclerospora sorghi TaxID=230839 RepID=A0ACC0WE68_9STRA|nr:hypothetical protein PsorP6_013270 [Peronosclerospora sorghi]
MGTLHVASPSQLTGQTDDQELVANVVVASIALGLQQRTGRVGRLRALLATAPSSERHDHLLAACPPSPSVYTRSRHVPRRRWCTSVGRERTELPAYESFRRRAFSSR